MRRLIIVLLVITAFLPVLETNAQNEPEILVVTPDVGVKFRSEPKQEPSNILDALKQGSKVKMLDEKGDWMKVDYLGKTGWIHKDYLSPFTADIASVYAAYIDILSTTYNPIKVIFYDFTQDGIEELYILENLGEGSPNYVQKIFSGKEIIYESSGEFSIDIYSDRYNYFIVESGYISRGESRELSYFGSKANEISPDFIYDGLVSTNEYNYHHSIIRPGNNKLIVDTLGMLEIEAGDILVQEYTKNDTSITKEQYESVEQIYANTTNHESIYIYDVGYAYLNPSHTNTNVQDIVAQIESAYNSIYTPQKSIEGLTEQEVGYFQNKVNQLIGLSIPFSEVEERNTNTFLSKWEHAMLMGKLGVPQEKFTYSQPENTYLFRYDRQPIEKFIYDFYGMKLRNDEFISNNIGEENTSLNDEYFVCLCDGLGSGGGELFHELTAVTPIDQDYIAVAYNRYDVPIKTSIASENLEGLAAANLLGTEYAIFKKIASKEGLYYPYIDTVDSIESVDYKKYNGYVEELDVYKEYISGQEDLAANETSQKETNIHSQKLLIVGGIVAVVLALVGTVVYFSRRKKK